MVISQECIEKQITSKVDEIIQLSVRKGRFDLAEDMASRGRASKRTVREEILPNFAKVIDALEPGDADKMYRQYRRTKRLVDIFSYYKIEMPDETVEKAAFFFLNNGCCNFAKYSMENSSKSIKEWVDKTIRERGLEQYLDEAPELAGKKYLSTNDLEKIWRDLTKDHPGYCVSLA
ncbi:MAG: hypothetical protein WC926_00630 [Candidatus Paceibacterota bacterium]|jgi:hypothetical protein